MDISADYDRLLPEENGADPDALRQLARDTSGVIEALRILESVAAEGREWVGREMERHRRKLADYAHSRPQTVASPAQPGPTTPC